MSMVNTPNVPVNVPIAEWKKMAELAVDLDLSVAQVVCEAVRAYNPSLKNQLSQLEQENQRLLEGDFTPTEFQNLCHCVPENDRDAFFAGCAEYQRKLFGISERDLYNQEMREKESNLSLERLINSFRLDPGQVEQMLLNYRTKVQNQIMLRLNKWLMESNDEAKGAAQILLHDISKIEF